jgi:ribosomal protein S8
MVYKIINLIKLSFIYKKKIIKTSLNKNEIKLINSLIKINLIKFLKKNENNYYIYLNYFNKKAIFQNIINLNRPSNPLFVNHKTLKRITNKYKIILILNTNKGVLTNFEAVNKKLGGKIILKLWN